MMQWIVSKETLLVLSFVLGVAFRSFFDFGISFVFLILLLSLVVFVDKKFLFFCLTLILFLLGLLRMDFALERDYFLSGGMDVNLSGLIIDEPVKSENSTRLVLLTEESKEKILVITERSNILKYGDTISLSGQIKRPENFETDNEREFNYVNYLAKDDIFYISLFPEIEKIKSGQGNFFKRNLFSLKNFLISNIAEVIPSPESEYLGGLLFGSKDSLGKELEEDFRRTGLIHVVVLSGYNVTIVAESILKTLHFLPLTLGLSLSALSIILFALMTGASATIIRASIMALIVILGKALSRNYDVTRALFIALFLMVLHNPKILIYDPSFQLSFLATIGLIHFSPIIEERIKFVTESFGLRGLISATLATQIFVLPFLLFLIGEFSIIAPISNLLVLPFIPLSMFFGFITSLLGIFSKTLSLIPAFLSYILLSYEIKVVELFSAFSFASVSIKDFPFSITLLVYLFIGFCIKYRTSNFSRK